MPHNHPILVLFIIIMIHLVVVMWCKSYSFG